LKTALISALALLLCLNTFGQSNYYRLSVGAGYGLTQSFTDIQSHDFERAPYGTLDYFFTPFLSLGAEIQAGKIRALKAPEDPYQRQFINSYKAATISGKVYLGTFIDYDHSTFLNSIKWLYVGTGAGLVRNSITKITRIRNNSNVEFPGRNSSYEIMFPVNLGINFYFPDQSGNPRFGINLNLQSNTTLGEGLDGYDDSSETFKAGFPDIYNYYSIGIRYHFGLLGISKKSL